MFLAECITTQCINGDCTAPNVCTCFSGWTGAGCATGQLLQIKAHTTQSLDINECLDNSTCGGVAVCRNTPESFICDCGNGYYYDRTKVACLGESSYT